MKTIGKAGDYYRSRIICLVDDGEPDLEWRSDVLYRRPSTDLPPDARAEFLVQLVELDSNAFITLKAFPAEAPAVEFRSRVDELLSELTKSGFDKQVVYPLEKLPF